MSSETAAMENLIHLSREDNEGDEKPENTTTAKLSTTDFENEP